MSAITFHEKCGCGAEIDVRSRMPYQPDTYLLAEWRANHRHEPVKAPRTPEQAQEAPGATPEAENVSDRAASLRCVSINPGSGLRCTLRCAHTEHIAVTGIGRTHTWKGDA